jgi:uncharacterized repeat protein (TIGR03803 family)
MALMKRNPSSEQAGRLDNTPKWDVIQTCLITRSAEITIKGMRAKLKDHTPTRLVLLLLVAAFGSMLAAPLTAETFTTLHTFSGGSDGGYPFASLVSESGRLYGTAYQGGSSGVGTVFSLGINGSDFRVVHDFGGASEGGYPCLALLLSGNTLYGTAWGGGNSGNGTVFEVNVDGTGFTNLHHFTAVSGPIAANSDGAKPKSGLILLCGALRCFVEREI